MFATTTTPVIVETRPADEPARQPKAEQPPAETPAPWEQPDWQAHREMVLAMPLYQELKAFLADCRTMTDEAFRLADALAECPEGKSPLSPYSGRFEDDYTDEAVGNLCAIARVLTSLTESIESDL